MPRHGVFVTEGNGAVAAPSAATSGVVLAIGVSPIQAASNPAPIGMPILVESFSQFKERFGYSNDWAKYPLCEVAYSQFKLFAVKPLIVINLLDPATMNTTLTAADVDVVAHRAELDTEVIDNDNLVVKAQGGAGSAYVKDTDYAVQYSDDHMIIELLPNGSAYSATKINVAGKKAAPATVNAAAVATGLGAIDYCATAVGVIPDIIIAPGYSDTAATAAAMGAKADAINGMFKAKAIVDINATTATTPATAITKKATDSINMESQIAVWPNVEYTGKFFHGSTVLAGCIAATDSVNGGYAHISPSNKHVFADKFVLTAGGNDIYLKLEDVNELNEAGIVTFLNWLNGSVAWGNYNACYPAISEFKDKFISASRMFGFVNNELIRRFWSYVDQPLSRRLVDSILDEVKMWLNGLVGAGYLLGADAVFSDAENALEDLMAGIVRIHVYITPPGPMQEVDFTVEYNAEFLVSAFQN